MQFLEQLTASDWTIILILDAALFMLGFMVGEDTAEIKKDIQSKWPSTPDGKRTS